MSSSSSDDEVVWSEPKNNQNDDWLSMIETKTHGKESRGARAKLEARKAKEKHELNIRNARELNPYIKHSEKGINKDDVYKLILEQKKKDEEKNTNENTQNAKTNALTESEKNVIHAKILKAELMGNHELAKQLKAKLESGDVSSNSQNNQQEERKVKYYTVSKPVDEESMSIKEMLFKEKRSTIDDEAKLFVASCSKVSNVDDEYEDRKKKKRKHEEKEKLEYVSPDSSDMQCKECITNVSKHLILFKKQCIFVSFPAHEPITYGHCFIRSLSHNNFCTVSADQDCLHEMNQAKKDLSRVFGEKGFAVVFIETYFKRKGKSKHLSIECFTLKKKYESDIRMYFKKGIMECEAEWSMNKKLVDLEEKCVTKKVPKGLSYFCVTIGPKNVGYAHVIEDEESFSPTFGIEIIAGFLDIDKTKWKRPKFQNYDEQFKRCVEIKSLYQKIS